MSENETPEAPESGIAAWYRHHPKYRTPSIFAIICWVALLVGGGVAITAVHISDRNANERVQRDHNASACSIRTVFTRLEASAKQSLSDPTVTPSAKARSAETIRVYRLVLNGQITTPANLSCSKLLADLAAKKKALAAKESSK